MNYEKKLRKLERLANPNNVGGNIGAVMTVDTRLITPLEKTVTIFMGLPNGSSIEVIKPTIKEAITALENKLLKNH